MIKYVYEKDRFYGFFLVNLINFFEIIGEVEVEVICFVCILNGEILGNYYIEGYVL